MPKLLSGPLREVISLFLRLGFTAFGGPAAHIAMMEDETVRRRRWLTREQFLDLFGAASLIPGPSSTELAMYLGYRLAGPFGLVMAGSLFIAPAMLIMLGIAVAYVNFGSTRAAVSALNGIRPVVVAIVAWALLDLGKRILVRRSLWPIAAGVFSPDDHHRFRPLVDSILGHDRFMVAADFVTPVLDHGPIIVQAAVPVLATDDASGLAERVLIQEHRIYPLAARWLLEGMISVSEGRVSVRGNPPQWLFAC